MYLYIIKQLYTLNIKITVNTKLFFNLEINLTYNSLSYYKNCIILIVNKI